MDAPYNSHSLSAAAPAAPAAPARQRGVRTAAGDARAAKIREEQAAQAPEDDLERAIVGSATRSARAGVI